MCGFYLPGFVGREIALMDGQKRLSGRLMRYAGQDTLGEEAARRYDLATRVLRSEHSLTSILQMAAEWYLNSPATDSARKWRRCISCLRLVGVA